MNYVRAQNLIDKGRGQAAKRLGQPYDIYRIQANSATNYLDPENKIFSGYLVLRRPNRGLGLIEGTLLTAVPWESMGDFRPWLLGDVFLQNDPVFGAGYTLVTFETLEYDAFCLAFHGPVKKTMAARLDRFASVYRPLSGNSADASGYLSGGLDTSSPLQLVTGNFQFNSDPAATPAMIPMGFSSHIRARGDLYPDIPTSTGTPVYMLYMPPVPGYLPKEGDRIVAQDGSQYVIHVPFEQEAGYVGYQLTVTRQVAQA